MFNSWAMDDSTKKPDIIYVDAVDEDEVNRGYKEQKYHSAIEGLKNAHFPVGLRILGAIVGAFAGMVTAFALIGGLFWLAVSLLALRQSEGMNAQAAKTLKFTGKCALITFGSFLTIFSPALGVGLIMLYFMINGEEMNGFLFSRFSSYSPHQN